MSKRATPRYPPWTAAFDPTAVVLGERLDDRQSQTGPLACFAGCEKRLEDVRQDFRGDARTRIRAPAGGQNRGTRSFAVSMKNTIALPAGQGVSRALRHRFSWGLFPDSGRSQHWTRCNPSAAVRLQLKCSLPRARACSSCFVDTGVASEQFW